MNQRSWIAGLLLVVLVPTLLLAPSLVGGKTFVPFDLAQFAPVATKLSAEELAEVRRDANYGPTEVVFTFVPELRFARQELEAGRLPLWNPYARFGAPLMATGVVGLLYPPNWLVLAHEDPQDGLALGALMSFVIAGGLMFGFLRALGLGLASCVFGAVAFSLSGTLVAQAHFYQRMASLVWLPGLLWGVHGVTGARGRARGRPAAGLAAAVGMTLLAGFPAYAAPVFLVAGIYALVRLASRDEESGTRPLATVGWLGAAFAVGLLLAAVQLLPMAAFFPESSRGGAPTPGGLAEQGLAPLALLLSLLMPSWIGHPLVPGFEPARTAWAFWALPRIDWESGRPLLPVWNYIEGTVFVGTLTVPLAALAGLWPKRSVERGMVAAAVVLAALSGGHAFLSWLHMAPGVQVVAPFRFLGPLCGVLAVLAACGLDRIVVESSSLRRRGLGVSLAVLGLGALWAGFHVDGLGAEGAAGRFAGAAVARFADVMPELTVEQVLAAAGGREAARAAAHDNLVRALSGAGIALLIAAAWWSLASWASRGPQGRAAAWRAVAAFGLTAELSLLAAPLLAGRELPFPHDTEVHAFLRAERDRLTEDGGYAVIRATAAPEGQKVLPTALGPCQLVPEHIRDANGYTFLDAHSHKLLERIYGADHFIKGNVWPYALPDDERLQHPALDLLGIRWVLSEDALTHAGEEVSPPFEGTRLRADGQPIAFHVYERTNALPRAFFVPELRVVPDEDAVLDALASPDFDPRAAAYVTAADAAGFVPAPPSAEPASRTVRFVRDAVQELVLEIGSGPAGHVVLNDSWFSGWQATIDGESASLRRTNLAMRSVALPASAGPLQLRLVYAPSRWVSGVSVALIGWLVVGVGVVLAVRRR